MSIFTCCTCPEPPDYDPSVDPPLATYINTCGCPSVAVECTSSSKTATLCGFDEFDGFESSPPKKYKTRSLSNGTETYEQYSCNQFCSPSYFLSGDTRATTINYERVDSYDDECSLQNDSETEGVLTTTERGSGSSPACGSGTSTSTRNFTISASVLTGFETSATAANWIDSDINYYTSGNCSGSIFNKFVRTLDATLSVEDTEANALDRATATDGTLCSSIYELRTTSFSFTKRTVTYSATASNLVVGVAYEGCVRIRKRESYSGTLPDGADTEWEDVEPDTISSFTATDTEEEVATDVDVPNAQGYEYEVVSAHVWPVSAGCDCPTSYTP